MNTLSNFIIEDSKVPMEDLRALFNSEASQSLLVLMTEQDQGLAHLNFEHIEEGFNTCRDEILAALGMFGDFNQVAWQVWAFGWVTFFVYVVWFKQWHYWRNLYYHDKVSDKSLDDQIIEATVQGRQNDVERLVKQKAKEEAKLAKEGKSATRVGKHGETGAIDLSRPYESKCSTSQCDHIQPRGYNGALHYAAYHNQIDCAIRLLKGGEPVNARNLAGFTPLQVSHSSFLDVDRGDGGPQGDGYVPSRLGRQFRRS